MLKTVLLICRAPRKFSGSRLEAGLNAGVCSASARPDGGSEFSEVTTLGHIDDARWMGAFVPANHISSSKAAKGNLQSRMALLLSQRV